MNNDDLRVPRHVGFIPDGNRRWAEEHGLPKRAGYAAGVEPGIRLFEFCRSLGIHEVSIYGFTKENIRRSADQVEAFRQACVDFALGVIDAGAALLVVGDADAPVCFLQRCARTQDSVVRGTCGAIWS